MKEPRTEVEIDLVPGHMRVEENEQADEAANEASKKSDTRRCPERFV